MPNELNISAELQTTLYLVLSLAVGAVIGVFLRRFLRMAVMLAVAIGCVLLTLWLLDLVALRAMDDVDGKLSALAGSRTVVVDVVQSFARYPMLIVAWCIGLCAGVLLDW